METPFSHYKSMGNFLDAQGQLSVVTDPIWPKFELVRDFMHALITCKYKKNQIKNNQEKVETSFSHYKSMGAFCCHGNQSFDRAPDKMRICVFHSNLNVKNSIIFGNVRIMYAKHFPDTLLCPVSKRICFVYILMECGLLPIFL